MGIFPTVSVRTTSPGLREALAHRGCVVPDAPELADVLVLAGQPTETTRDGITVSSSSGSDAEVTEDLFARVDRALLTPAEGLVVTGRATGRSVTLSFAPLDGEPAARSFAELVHNAVCHVAVRPTRHPAVTVHPLVQTPAWTDLKAAVTALRALQVADGSVPETSDHAEAAAHVGRIVAFAPAQHRVDGLPHLVVFPMYTQNGNPGRQVEAVLLEVIWPDFVADLEAGDYSNKLFLPIRFLDFTAGYDTNSAVLFPETVAMREVPAFTWGGIFADREAARFRRVVTEAAAVTRLSLPPDAARLIADQELAERAFVMWDLIHDRTHMHGDLPFDPFMIKQRMPYFLYSLEELRCDLTAFREAVTLEAQGHPYARSVQYAVLFDRIFRFAITGDRTRNYDGLGGQLLFAWLHQQGVLHWTDNRLTIEWDRVAEPVLELGRKVEDLYWRSIDRPKTAHWLAAYDLVASVLTPHPLSAWARHRDGDLTALPLDGPPKGLTDAVLPDEFPLSMFYEALSKKMKGVIESTAGITGTSA